jgi:hypothetical protein
LCQEYMVFAGEQHVPESHFVPRVSLPTFPPFLQGPYRMDVFVCSHCFTLHQRLSEKDRTAVVKRLSDHVNEDEE